jgi:hypothetical protein
MHLVSSQNEQVVFTPGRTGKPGKNYQQNANFETDENEKDDCQLDRHANDA